MVVLAIDIGNSRIKWGCHDGSQWIATGAADHASLHSLDSIWTQLPRSGMAIGSNVADPAFAHDVGSILEGRGIAVRWIDSLPAQRGVRNLYADPSQLGSDRWAALIGARAMQPRACVVVAAGTAVTIDALTADGDFLGGLILPGLTLMSVALARDTARLSCDTGSYVDYPRATADAITTGAIDAITGAVQRFVQRLEAQAGAPVAIIGTGGAIGSLAPHLAGKVHLVENLVLEGLRIIAAEP
jgi:type III pantothenate kinase